MAESVRFSQRLLVDIDCLFDTRLGWLSVHHPEELKKLLPQAYYNRFTDTWAEVIGVKKWHERFAKRDAEALRHAKPTRFLEVLSARLEAMLLQIQMSSPMERPVLTINMYPYTDLTGPEVAEFTRMFRDYYDMVNVHLITTPPEELSPQRLVSHWDGYAMWDWFGWIGKNAKHFETQKMPGFPLFIVAMFTPELTSEVIESIQNGKQNPFKETQRQMVEFALLEHVDSALFSLDPEFQAAVFPASRG